jgi:HSP20 family molecular chaperone IbpA
MNIKLSHGVLISFISFLAGGIVTYFVTDYVRLKNQTNVPHNNPFDQVDKMHDQMRKRMDQFFGGSFGHSFTNSVFDIDPFSGSSFTTNNININHYEDNQYKYIEVTGEGVNRDSLKVDISGGLISISGEIKQVQEDNNSGSMSRSSYISTFNQSLNIPQGVDEANVKIESEDNKLIIKFPIDRI